MGSFPASSFMVGNAPGGASYQGQRVDFSGLGTLLQDYMSGNQARQTLAQQNAYPTGIPRDAQGGVDVGKILDTQARLGGAQGMGSLLQSLLAQSAGNELAGAGTQPGAPGTQGAGGQTAGPANVMPRQQGAPGKGSQPGSLSDIVGNLYDDPNQQGQAIASLAKAFRISDPDSPLDSQTAQSVGDAIQKQRVAALQPQGGQPAGGAPVAPQPAARVAQAFGDARAGPATDTTAGLLPGDTPQAVANLRRAADAIQQRATSLAALNKPAAEEAQKRATVLNARADAIEGRMAKGAERPANIAQKAEEEQRGAEIKRGDAMYKGLQGAGRAADEMKPHLDAMQSIISSPGFSSGGVFGGEAQLAFKRLMANMPGWMGGDPNAALPNEAIRKVLAANIQTQLAQMKDEAAEMGGTSGRVFKQQIDLMEKASQTPDNTPAALRYLTEMGQRSVAHARAVAAMAAEYKGGRLDTAFDQKLADYNRQHPIFTPAELADIRLVAPPRAPKLDSADQAKAWAKQQGLKPGDPMKLPSGRIVPAP